MNEKKTLEVVSGDGSNLDITLVYDHINAENPKNKKEKPKNIVIPKSKSENTNNSDDNEDIDNNTEKKEEN